MVASFLVEKNKTIYWHIQFFYSKIKLLNKRRRILMSKRLYRYISFEDFVNLLINNKDRFVRPASWEDKYEGYLFSHIETKEEIR